MVGTRPIPFPLTVMFGTKHVTKVAPPWLSGGRGGICSWGLSVASEGRKEKPFSSPFLHYEANYWEKVLFSLQRPGVLFSPMVPSLLCMWTCEQPHVWGKQYTLSGINMLLTKAVALPSRQDNNTINFVKYIHFCLFYRSLNVPLVTKRTVLIIC